jgi:hypothetical protein
VGYGLGVELRDAGVLATTATTATDRGPVTTLPPVLVMVDGAVTVGDDALALAKDHPTSVVADVVRQFAADRLWFVDGRMLNPDDAMRELLGGVTAMVERSHDERPAAVTVSYPPGWEEAEVTRLRAVVDQLGLASPAVVPGLDAGDAAGHASLRVVDALPLPDAAPLDLPQTQADVIARRQLRPPIGPDTQPPPPPPEPSAPRRRIPGPVIYATALILLVGGIAAAIFMFREDKDDDETTPTTEPPATSIPESTSTGPRTSALALGAVTDDAGFEADLRAVVREINDGGGVFGRELVLVIQPAGDDPAASVNLLVEQGAGALVTDAGGNTLDGVLAAAAPTLATCVAGSVTDAPSGVIFEKGDARRCVELLSLAAVSAEQPDAPSVRVAARDLVEFRGIKCATFVECKVFLEASQPITYTPEGGSPPPITNR